MRRRIFAGALAAGVLTMVLAVPASAHGDHDARPLARELPAGPHRISLWQVYPDAGGAMTPHLIVLFDGEASRPAAKVDVSVGSTPTVVVPSMTTANGWETMDGVGEGDVVTVTISDGGGSWDLAPIVVPAPSTSMLPMQELIYASIFLTLGTAFWLVGRTARAWRRPALRGT